MNPSDRFFVLYGYTYGSEPSNVVLGTDHSTLWGWSSLFLKMSSVMDSFAVKRMSRSVLIPSLHYAIVDKNIWIRILVKAYWINCLFTIGEPLCLEGATDHCSLVCPPLRRKLPVSRWPPRPPATYWVLAACRFSGLRWPSTAAVAICVFRMFKRTSPQVR